MNPLYFFIELPTVLKGLYRKACYAISNVICPKILCPFFLPTLMSSGIGKDMGESENREGREGERSDYVGYE
jgi:hypothetical protein